MARVSPAELPDDLPIKNNLVAVTYKNPEMHRGFASLSGRVNTASRLAPRTRELVILSVAGKLNAGFEWRNHEQMARRIGINDAEISALRTSDANAFSGADRAAVLFALIFEANKVDDAAWNAAREHFSEDELLDMSMLAGFYGLASRFVNALAIE